jgi:outer membrane PBP1 activator LpoA protein
MTNRSIPIMISLALSLPAAAQDGAKIGFLTTLSGGAAVIGNEMRDGFELGLDPPRAKGRWASCVGRL